MSISTKKEKFWILWEIKQRYQENFSAKEILLVSVGKFENGQFIKLFSRFGEIHCKTNTPAAANFKNSFNSLHLICAQNQFQFRFTTEFELKKELTSLNSQKPAGPSSIPPWALKDESDVIVGHLTNVNNSFISEKSFPTTLKLPMLLHCSKRMILITLKTIGLSKWHLLYQKLLRLLQKQVFVFSHNERCYSETHLDFRNNYSTIDILLYCTESFRLARDKNKIITAARPELSKAFDPIKHNIF